MHEYGLMIERKNVHGSEYISYSLCRREPGKDHPLGCRSDGEYAFDKDVPKHLRGLNLDGLGSYGFVSDANDAAFIGYEPEYRDVFALHLPRLQAMAKTLKRVLARRQKDQAREPGDTFASMAAALKLTFACVRRKPGPANNFANNDWQFMTVAEGRNRYRALIEEAQAAQRERMGLAKSASEFIGALAERNRA